MSAQKLRAAAVTSAKVRDGALRLEDFAADERPTGAAGPQGPAGPAGPRGERGERGERGPSDAFGAFYETESIPPAAVMPFDLAALDLPPGRYVVTGTFFVVNGQEHPRDLDCGIGVPGVVAGPGAFDGAVDRVRVSMAPADAAPVTLLGMIEIVEGDQLSLGCYQSGTVGTTVALEFEDIDIGAVQVGALNGG